MCLSVCSAGESVLRSKKSAAGILHCPQEKQCEGGIAMDMAPRINENPDQTTPQPAAHNLVKRILKLRWMGMDDEAEHVHVALQKVEPAATVPHGPADTD
jgi:hypothetical protein